MSVGVHTTLDELVRLEYLAKGFSLLPRQPVESLLSGRHASRLRGRGLTFEELRDYRPGDDIRSMDWKATARLRKPHVRVYSEERERPVLLVVDQRQPMFFGSARATKAKAAAELAAVGAWRTLDAGDRVGAILFNDQEIIELKPHRSRTNVLRICHELVEMNQQLAATFPGEPTVGLNDALLRAVNVAKHDHLVVLITDYHGNDSRTGQLATRLVSHNDVLAALVYDPLGIRLPVQSGMVATDGRRELSPAASSDFGDRFEEAFRRRCQEIQSHLRALRIPMLPICTHEPVIDQVLYALGRRR